MAMRPEVRRYALIIIVFGLVQWGFVMNGLHNNLWPLDKSERILTFCVSAFVAAWCLMGGLLYMAVKGNKDN